LRSTLLFLNVLLLASIFCLSGCNRDVERKRIDTKEVLTEEELDEFSDRQVAEVLWFGFDLRSSPQEDARQYLSFLRYLEKTTGYKFKLRITPRGGNIVDDLGLGVVHFAAIGAGSYIEARTRYGIIPLVRGLNTLGKAEYQSVIVVVPESPIRKVKDLLGKRIAFGSVTSTQGHLIPRAILSEHGVALSDLAGYEFFGSHHDCANAVISRLADACGMQDTMGRELENLGMVRIIHTSKYYPSSGIAADKHVNPEVIGKIRQALLDFQPTGKDSEGLYNWDLTEMPLGFVLAKEEDYSELMALGLKMGIFKEYSR
jgi:phosphonate transport system substrate-binding protein